MVAAFPVPGPLDVVTDRSAGVVDGDLRRACMSALGLDRQRVAEFGSTFSWEQATYELLVHVKRSTISPAGNRLPISAAAQSTGQPSVSGVQR